MWRARTRWWTPTTSRSRPISTAGPRASWVARPRSRRTSSRRASSTSRPAETASRVFGPSVPSWGHQSPKQTRSRTRMKYELSDVIRVEENGPVRTVTSSRPDALNATNDELHFNLAQLFRQLSADTDARVAVITGAGRAFSAGGDF